jgi:hypothetical protein
MRGAEDSFEMRRLTMEIHLKKKKTDDGDSSKKKKTDDGDTWHQLACILIIKCVCDLGDDGRTQQLCSRHSLLSELACQR